MRVLSLGPNAESRLYKIAHWARAFQRQISDTQDARKPQQDHPNEIHSLDFHGAELA
jgi:hypothetical protein